MPFLNRAKKNDFLQLCDDLRLVVTKNTKITDLIEFITESENYDADFAEKGFKLLSPT